MTKCSARLARGDLGTDLNWICDAFHRTTTNYGPKEYGAKGNGSADDTLPLQNWINANQPHIGDVGTYMVSSPLTCPQNTTVQGPENLANGTNPLFNIDALSNFAGYTSASGYALQGVIAAYDFCRLSGVVVTGNGFDFTESGTTNY